MSQSARMANAREHSGESAPMGVQLTTTHWSVVVAAGDVTLPGAIEALEQLCGTYWYPLYAYVRRRRQMSYMSNSTSSSSSLL